MTEAYSGTTLETRWRAARRAVLLTLLVAVPLVFDTSVWPVFALPKFTVAVSGALLILGLAAMERLVGRAATTRGTLMSVPVFLVVSWTAVCAVATGDVRISVVGSRETYNGLATMAAFAVVFMTAARDFDKAHVEHALYVLWFGSGTAVLLYGAVQLHGEWDPIHWVPFADVGSIWSTLGNPNDLAGFLAIILPVGLVLLLLVRHPLARALTATMTVLVAVELVVTASRGALVAAVVAVVVVGAGLRPRRVVTVLAALVAVAAVLAVAGLAVTSGDGPGTEPGSTISLRLELWATAWRMTVDNPLVGVGPDRFAESFDEYRSREFDDVYGPELVATDAHNLLLTRLAEHGVPGGLALLGLLGWGVAVCIRAGRSLKAKPPPDHARLLLVGVSAALLAYVVQAMFNRQDIALDFCFWVLLGLACALARAHAPGDGSGGSAGSSESHQGNEDGEGAHP